MAQTIHRNWLLMRKLEEKKSLFFSVLIRIKEDEPALFGATVDGLDNRLAAAGESVDEAESNALDMFRGLVDYTLDKRIPLGNELGSPIPYLVVPIGLDQAEAFFDGIKEAMNAAAADELEEWRTVPTSVLVASAETLTDSLA